MSKVTIERITIGQLTAAIVANVEYAGGFGEPVIGRIAADLDTDELTVAARIRSHGTRYPEWREQLQVWLGERQMTVADILRNDKIAYRPVSPVGRAMELLAVKSVQKRKAIC